MKTHICLIFSLLVLLSQSSCIEDDYRGPEPYPSTRTVLFYLAADNNVGAEIGLTPEFLPDHNGFRIDRHSGLTTYIPRGVLPVLDEVYTRTAWCRATRIINKTVKINSNEQNRAY